jgi:hypothetical protein
MRVLLSTIRSSRKLPVDGDDEDVDVLGRFEPFKDLQLSNENTIVVFDEAGHSS